MGQQTEPDSGGHKVKAPARDMYNTKPTALLGKRRPTRGRTFPRDWFVRQLSGFSKGFQSLRLLVKGGWSLIIEPQITILRVVTHFNKHAVKCKW